METFKHIELTPEEYNDAIIQAKQKKERALKEQEVREREYENRMFLLSQWSVTQTRQFMTKRAESIFNGDFKLDASNERIFELLCLYFSEDPKFNAEAQKDGITGASLEKGILLAGTVGTGKTWLMKLFGKNRRQVYHIHNAKEIAKKFQKTGDVDEYVTLHQNPLDDKASFYHQFAGLCLDDIGSEAEKNHFGNKENVIGDLIFQRYDKRAIGIFLHATTNLNADGLKEFYGERITSRMREIFNIIQLKGNDRRK